MPILTPYSSHGTRASTFPTVASYCVIIPVDERKAAGTSQKLLYLGLHVFFLMAFDASSFAALTRQKEGF